MKTDNCPISGCNCLKETWKLVCVSHWYKVSKAKRDQLFKLYRQEPGGKAHRAACFEILRALNEGQKI